MLVYRCVEWCELWEIKERLQVDVAPHVQAAGRKPRCFAHLLPQHHHVTAVHRPALLASLCMANNRGQKEKKHIITRLGIVTPKLLCQEMK